MSECELAWEHYAFIAALGAFVYVMILISCNKTGGSDDEPD